MVFIVHCIKKYYQALFQYFIVRMDAEMKSNFFSEWRDFIMEVASPVGKKCNSK